VFIPQIHPTAFIADSAQVIGDVHVGDQASVWFGTVARGDMFYIRIGDRTNVQDNCVLHTRTGELPTVLEDEVTVGHSVTLHGCYIEHGSLIGMERSCLTMCGSGPSRWWRPDRWSLRNNHPAAFVGDGNAGASQTAVD